MINVFFSFYCNFFNLEIADAEFDKDENAKQKKYAHCKKEVIPFYMGKLDAIAKENNGYMAIGRVGFLGRKSFYEIQLQIPLIFYKLI